MQAAEFARHIEQGPVAPVYLFTGDADLLMEEAWKKLVEKIVPASARRFNGDRLTARECSAAQVVERLSTLPMFGAKQLLLAQNIDAWPKDQLALILSYLAHPRPTACLVMTTSKKKGLEKLTAAVTAAGKVISFAPPAEKDVPRWLQERVKLYGKILPPQAAALLVDRVGVELHLLERELEKLATYIGERERIEVEDVRQAVSSQRSFSVFELLRSVSQRQGRKAVSTLRSLILSGEPSLTILALLARQVRLIWQAKDGLSRGLPEAQIVQGLNLPPFVVRGYIQQAASFSEADLYGIHQAIRETDLAIKSTGTAPEIMLEALVLSLCTKKQKAPEA